jgi:hypothetical protein
LRCADRLEYQTGEARAPQRGGDAPEPIATIPPLLALG